MTRPRLPARACLLAAAVLAASAAPARADVFSPGDLARAHANLEGLTQCTRCHAAGQQVSQEKCLECHKELSSRISRGQGFHGHLPAAERACQACHHEHQGRGFSLVDWGDAGRKAFDHARTGWPLRGKHAGLDCARCHEPRRVADPEVRELLAKGRKDSHLGLATACGACHFDEHRGQLGADCQRCHSERSWKPARRFDHDRTAYPLAGRHRAVSCGKCHAPREDAQTPAGAFPAPVARTFAAYKPVAHASCLDCHADPHRGRLGQSCQSCHVVAGWKTLKGDARERAFHQRTRYPLEGAHLSVECGACHGPHGGQRARYRGIPFAACSDCHLDAHVGQLAKARDRTAAACDRCHTVQGFLPVRFELEDHARSSYPLEGAHRAVACGACHGRDTRLADRVPAPVRASMERQQRPVNVSLAVLAPRADRCETCHRDPHGGQFAARAGGCAGCHRVTAFADLAFDHGRDARFPLQGKHARTPCASCHRAEREGPVRWRGAPAACASCHADPHAGQFAARGGRADCARCHSAEAWKPARFEHAPPFTTYRLEGKHAKVACQSCHPVVTLARGVEARRYRPLPRACEGCHTDFHQGAFRGFEP